MEKPADTQHKLLDVIRHRWSPHSFDSRLVDRDQILSLLEAVRWSASTFNEQPWRLIMASQEDEGQFQKALECLSEKNQQWVAHAPLLIIALAKKTFSHNGKPNRNYLYDLGLGIQSLTLQAMDMGLFSHQIGGIDAQKVRQQYQVDEDFSPVTAIAIGYPNAGGADHLPDWVQKAEANPRQRKSLEEIVWNYK